jgi:GntR family transcriptional regulator of arabinose operon
MDKKLKYYDLMEDLRKQIVSGKIKPGEKLPSENELSGTYQVSRQTVRKALQILQNEGYLCGTWTWNVLFGDGETHG